MRRDSDNAAIYQLDQSQTVPLRASWGSRELVLYLDVKIPKSDFVEEIVYFLPVIETEPIEYLYSDPSDLDSELQELEAIEERELRKSYEISGLVLKPTCDSLNEFTRQGMFIAKAMGIEKLRDGFHCFDKISEESGLEYVEG